MVKHESVTVQGVKPWPYFCFARRPELLLRYKLSNTSLIERYDVRSHTWRQGKVDTVFKVRYVY